MIRVQLGTFAEPSSFGTLLRELRASSGLTQADLAGLAGLSVRGISDLERGARKAPHPYTVRQLAAAMQLTDEQLNVLLRAARGGHAPADSAEAESPDRSRAPTWRRTVAITVAGAALVAVLGLAALVFVRPASPQVAATPLSSVVPSPGAAGDLILADNLANPSTAVFIRAQSSSSVATFSNGDSATYPWDFEYMFSAIVAHVLGPYPANPDGAWLAASATLNQPLPRDFAVQVRGRVTRSPESSAFGLGFQLSPDQQYQFYVTPADQGFRLEVAQDQAAAVVGQSTWILPASQPNLVRLETRGDTLRILINGHELAREAPPGLTARQGGKVSLRWAMTGPPSEGGSVEVRFAQFALYTLP